VHPSQESLLYLQHDWWILDDVSDGHPILWFTQSYVSATGGAGVLASMCAAYVRWFHFTDHYSITYSARNDASHCRCDVMRRLPVTWYWPATLVVVFTRHVTSGDSGGEMAFPGHGSTSTERGKTVTFCSIRHLLVHYRVWTESSQFLSVRKLTSNIKTNTNPNLYINPKAASTPDTCIPDGKLVSGYKWKQVDIQCRRNDNFVANTYTRGQRRAIQADTRLMDTTCIRLHVSGVNVV